MKEKRGITLMALVVTIMVLVILAGVSIAFVFGENGIIERSKWAKFATEFREVEEKQQLYVSGKLTAEYISQQAKSVEERNGLSSVVTPEEKNKIKKEKNSLRIKMQELSGKSIDDMQIYWIDKGKIGTSQKKSYLLDIENNQVYQYEGEEIFGLIWHTLEGGIEKNASIPSDEEELWEGWMKLTLYYPENSTEHRWRIGREGETRNDTSLQWQEYVGPIWVRIVDVENVWIRYKMNGEDIIIPPAGRVLVDIEPDSYYPDLKQNVKVTIHYDKTAEIKEYKVGNSDWQEYTEPFTVTENTLVEARAKRMEKIADEEGNLLEEKAVWGTDNIYINNIGIEETELSAPTITKLAGGTGEVAKVHIDYPQGADKLVYKVNYGEEKNYTQDIGITKNGTYVIAYYYDSNGKRSKSSSILIEQNGANNGGSYTPNEPGENAGIEDGGNGGGSDGDNGNSGSNPINPSINYKGPNINVDSNYNVTVTIPEQVSNKEGVRAIYYKIGNENYQKYTGSFKLTKTSLIYAYYITSDGYYSHTTIQMVYVPQIGKPAVSIHLDPNPYTIKYGVNKVIATITASNTTNIEYSLDGVVYQPYTRPIEITKNRRIYAKGINSTGETIEYADITNIGQAPVIPDKLTVSIMVNPEPLTSTTLVDKVKVTINYDKNAGMKYYRLGKKGDLQEYIGPFEVSRNTTIYAYATSENGYGTDSKMIDNLIDGISEPKITSVPTNKKQTSQDTITITFDKNAQTRKYKIDNGEYIEYTGPFIVEENCMITAYNSNSKGDEAETSYEVTNMIMPPQKIVIDKGSYYLIKLPYPINSIDREYKWQDKGNWKSYPEDGILLIKTEYKNQIIGGNGNIIIQIEDENGKKINFTGDYYFITKPINELIENISMRWKNKIPLTPEIVVSTEEPTKVVEVTINYDENLQKKQYLKASPGSSAKWTDYTGVILVTEKNTSIYARGQDETGTWSQIASKRIINIDEEPPKIEVTADLIKEQVQVGIKVTATDDMQVSEIKWAEGLQAESYFISKGTTIKNNSIVYAQKNGYYTFYCIDAVGNKTIYTLLVENIIPATNEPDISAFNKENTYYVTWNATGVINEGTKISEEAPSDWYNYIAGENKWANIKTTGGGNDCYWVWIPRYAYKVPARSSTAQTISIKFLQGDTNIPMGEKQAITNTTPTPGNWVVHPAFTNEGNGGFGELTGIWVAKFQASSHTSYATNFTSFGASNNGDNATDKVKIVPNVTSWRNITVNNIFTVCRNMTNSGNSLEKTTNIDSHMMKNTEWGAVAYLSRSVYGKNGQVWNNPWLYDNKTYFSTITGRANKNNNANAFLNGNSTVNYNSVTDAYNVGNGPNASTSGTVYGVYDMAGAAWEYVAGYLSAISPLKDYTNLANAADKYKDKYIGKNATDTKNYGVNTNKYGDAVYETSTEGTGDTSWNSDNSYYPFSSNPIFERGGRADKENAAGVFAFNRQAGTVGPLHSFRPVLVIQQ